MGNRNDGKSLERTIRLIQETFKDSEHTEVFPSHKIICPNGLTREFDVIIKSKVNGMNICIAMECKDYGKKVAVGIVEQFKSKCDSIKEINKMVIVSPKGFQSGAVVQAKNFGIELMTAEEVSTEYLNDLVTQISHYNLKIIDINNYRYNIASQNEDILNNIDINLETKFYESETGKELGVVELIKKTIDAAGQAINALALKHYVKFKNSLEENPAFPVSLGMTFPFSKYYINDIKGNRVNLTEFRFDVSIKLVEIISEVSGRVIKNQDDSIQAHSIVLKNDNKSESELIIKPDNDFNLFYTENKETTQLKKLFKYDPKTKEIRKC
ncbi:restriction endonuclease [Flavobacterium procerum]|uniref:Restriction endonuclease n=1 Tax=Flavobacterium procerum TaxID=1455569 RepID=A0ABV6BPP8_9FLAO